MVLSWELLLNESLVLELFAGRFSLYVFDFLVPDDPIDLVQAGDKRFGLVFDQGLIESYYADAVDLNRCWLGRPCWPLLF